MRPGRYCIRFSRVFTSAVSWSRLCLVRLASDREEARALPTASVPAAVPRQAGAATAEQQTCSGRDGDVPCGRKPLPSRSVCGVHRVHELAGDVA